MYAQPRTTIWMEHRGRHQNDNHEGIGTSYDTMQTEKQRERMLRIPYNIGVLDWEKIAAYQGNVCFICNQPAQGRRLSTDHSHENGLIRGLLCQRCNAVLGKIENAFKQYGLHKVPGFTVCAFASMVFKYLQAPPAVAALGREVFGYPGRIGTKEYRKWVKKKIHEGIKTSDVR